METGGGADKMCFEDRKVAGGRGTAARAGVSGAHGVGSAVGPSPGGGVELEEARLDPLSRASSSAMLVAIWLTVPSSAAMRGWSSEVEGVCEAHARGAPKDVGGWRCVRGAPEYARSMPAGVGSGEACVGGG
ncbi:hypothetical protein CRG98_026943 [Punica granatum]|uniref:Uncharacterized protein n=1 Tax=Punica granatum TaxID=22663 RepID=A0A2I0J8V2_PUNGR|nr:hypothetical protein CRG98_026943 [Punica granatum]